MRRKLKSKSSKRASNNKAPTVDDVWKLVGRLSEEDRAKLWWRFPQTAKLYAESSVELTKLEHTLHREFEKDMVMKECDQPETADAILRWHHKNGDGLSFGQIANRLNDNGYPSNKNGDPWNARAVQRLHERTMKRLATISK